MRPYPQEIADLVTFTEEIFIGKLHFLCSGGIYGPLNDSVIIMENSIWWTLHKK